jgi:hypothetical protein
MEVFTMRTILGSIFLAATLVFFLFTTWSSAVSPKDFASQLGLAIANPGGANEIRAQYAGVFFAAAVVCALALSGTVPRLTAFIVLAMIFGGLIAGRLASLGLNRGFEGFGATILALYVIDGFGFIAAAGMIIAELEA